MLAKRAYQPERGDAAAQMLCGTSIADVEAKLSAALTASLGVAAADRPLFIAQHLQGLELTVQPVTSYAQPPADLDEQIAVLTKLTKDAINSASRRSGEPVQSIAMFFLRQCGEDEAEPEPVPKPAPAPAPEPELFDKPTGSSAAESKPSNMAELKAKLGIAPKASTPRRTGLAGASPADVLPAVVSAFQEEAARKAAKQVDENLIEQALAAGKANAVEIAKAEAAEAAEARQKEKERRNRQMGP